MGCHSYKGELERVSWVGLGGAYEYDFKGLYGDYG